MTTQTQTTTRIALVTGGNRGLGRSTALALAASGTDVVLTHRGGAEQATAVVEEIAAHGRRGVALRLDTTEPETFTAIAAIAGLASPGMGGSPASESRPLAA